MNAFIRKLDPKDAMGIAIPGELRKCIEEKQKGKSAFRIDRRGNDSGFTITILGGNLIIESRDILKEIHPNTDFKEEGGKLIILGELSTNEIYLRIKDCLESILKSAEIGPLDKDDKSRDYILSLPEQADDNTKKDLVISIRQGCLEYASKVEDIDGVRIEVYAKELKERSH